MEIISIMRIKVYILFSKDNKTIPSSLCSDDLDSFGVCSHWKYSLSANVVIPNKAAH